FEKDIHTYGFAGFTLGQRNLLIPFKDGGIDELKIYDRELTALEVLVSNNPEEADKVLQNTRLPPNTALLKEHYRSHFDPREKSLQDSLRRIRTEENNLMNAIPEIMVMGDLPEPRPTYLLD